MNMRKLLKTISGSVLAVALMMSALPALAADQEPPDGAPLSTGVSDAASSAGGGGSLIWWFAGGAVVIAVIGFFFYSKGKKKKPTLGPDVK